MPGDLDPGRGLKLVLVSNLERFAGARMACGLSSCSKLASFLGLLYCTKGDR